ncbi:phage tail protein, partial [Streptomyces prasinopilosus]|uniref:phage tail protein n=1 Tax=Streptomyces prasinopilosus TaxID=67344 RepID=UPI00099E7E07
MRGSVDGLGSSAPIGAMLPAIFADDDLAQRFVAGLDEVLAPFLVVLDNLDSYFDPALAPVDFTRWLADWVGAETDGIETGADDERSGNASAGVPAGGSEGERRLRAAVAAATYLHRVRGTRRGLSEAVRLVFGVTPEITESGAADWHARPLGPVQVRGGGDGGTQPAFPLGAAGRNARGRVPGALVVGTGLDAVGLGADPVGQPA